MSIVKHYLFLFFISIDIRLVDCEIIPFFIDADQIYLQCPDGQFESVNNTINIHSTCFQRTQLERFSLSQLYIQCPEERLYLEFNRTFAFNAQVSEYSIANLHPHCFLDSVNQHVNQQRLMPYQTRYTSTNGTLTQILSFQCQHNLTVTTSESLKMKGKFDLFFQMMNYGLCRYSIQFTSSNGRCYRFEQQTYKIQVHVKDSMCYYQLGSHRMEIPLDYLDQLASMNLSTSIHYPTKPMHRTMIIFTASITAAALLLCFILIMIMFNFGLFQY